MSNPGKNNFSHSEEIEISYNMAKRLLPFLAKRGIPATPKNYRIFYDYLAYSNPMINQAISEILVSDTVFDRNLTDRIYERLYSNEAVESQAQALSKATLDIQALSSTVGKSLEDAMSQADRYQKKLSDSSRQMAGMTMAEGLQPILDELLTETESSLKSQGGLSRQIERANEIIADLKKELSAQTAIARIDELTRLFNRRHFNMEAPAQFVDAERGARPISVIIFDLDHFKKINDIWGHQTGDRVLALCAQAIQKASRGNDMAVRMGGEEFLLLCPGATAESAQALADRIRSNIATTDITVRGDVLPVTISAGVSQHIPGENMEAVLARADAALYKAKGEGRNRVCVG